MSRSLPPEILDLIVDHLHDEPTTLRICCIVSKSWVPRTRKHLFAHVEFNTFGSPIKFWMEAFPDPSDSPAHHARSLSIQGFPGVIAACTNAVGWVHAFRHVVTLNAETTAWSSQVSLLPLRGLSPTLKSLRLVYSSIPPSEIFDLICSFPLLEDLALSPFDRDDYDDGWDIPSTSPKLTGSLHLENMGNGIRSTIYRLLDLPNSLHFPRIVVEYLNEDVKSITDLVSRCSDTLEFLSISCSNPDADSSGMLDLSKATKLKHLMFRCGHPSARWIALALQTAESNDLRQITIHVDATSRNFTRQMIHQEWQDLDRLLVQFWTSRLVRPKVVCVGEHLRECAPSLLPELSRRGLVDTPPRELQSRDTMAIFAGSMTIVSPSM